MNHTFPRPARSAFTLIELLVVIGIIAILLGILLPMLGAVREHAQTAMCMSNLRQISAAALSYSSDNSGIVVPEDYRDLTVSAGTYGYAVAESWETILVSRKYIAYPIASSTAPPVVANILRCPTGSSDFIGSSGPADSLPASRTDGTGGLGGLNQSKILQPGLNVYSWYGINGSSGATADIPVKRIPPDGAATNVVIVTRLASIKKPQHLVFIFDGMYINIQEVNPNRVNARHNRQRFTNIAFFDGHVESIATATLPGGAQNAGFPNPAGTTYSLANLKLYSHPTWRMDQ